MARKLPIGDQLAYTPALTPEQVAEIKRYHDAYPCPAECPDYDNVTLLLADRDELVRRLGETEAAAAQFFASDSWCAGLRDHVSERACPCGYAQLRAAFGPAAPMEDAT